MPPNKGLTNKGSFEKCYLVTRKYEGGNIDHPRDPGGRTSRGVTQKTYDAYRRNKGQATRDVYLAADTEVKDIYKTQYFDEVRGDELPAGVNLCCFDTAINSGANRAIRLLQASLNARQNARLDVDGQLGMKTIDAVMGNNDNDALIAEFGRRRQGFFRGLRTWSTFGRGWTARNTNCVKIAQAWASGSVAPKPVPVASLMGNSKAADNDIAESRVTPTQGIATAGTGTLLTTGAKAIQDTASSIEPLAQAAEVVMYLFIALTVIGLLIGAFGAYGQWKERRMRSAEETAPMPTVEPKAEPEAA